VALRALAQSEGATLFMMLLASYRVVLSRWSGQAEVVVGTPIAGRVRVEVEGLIGFFVNTLGLRGEVRERESVREMLRREREVCLGGYGAQEVPFEKVVEEMEPERSLTHSPIFQVFFNLLNARDNDFELSGLTIEMLGDEVPATKFDITLYARERESGLHLEMVYNADLFDQELMVEMLEQYALLLRSVAREPDAPLMNHSLVTLQAEAVLPRASAPLSAGWDGAVQSGFDRQASLNPERIAVRDSFGAWTYAQLGVGSNDLARRLRAGGIRRGEVVAVYAHRSASLVRALLGVLKAGAAFVILDPAYPAARLIECLKVAKPRGWIQLEAAGELPEQLEAFLRGAGYRCRITLPKTLEREGDESGRESLVGDSEESVTEPDDPAYIAFTSGSTGEPKGVLGSHRPLSHFLHWHVGTFGLQASDRFTLLSGLSHDPLLRDIFTPLRLGATLCIPDEEKMAAPGELLAWMRHEAVTVTHLTPAMAQWLAGARPGANRNGDGSLPALPLLRYAFFGGDVLTAREVSLMRELSGSVTCVNFYGTTETPQAMAYHIVEPLDTSKARDESLPDGRQIIPLGRGIADVQLLLLNGAQQPAGIGELGEIYVRTPYLSQGYAGEATATAERFIINPATGRSKDLYYRTGDLGRYLPGGEVMFVGRADRQVKIRGFRVEPGEVEAALGEHASVRAAAVKAYEDASGAQCLVAYVAPRAGSTPTINDLHNSLRERLPGHMIPSNIVCLDEMPLTPNGKIDYGALPTPDLTNPATGKEFIAPRTPVEIQMSEIWSEVLGVARVGINDNFFTLGGHSLLATQVVSRMRESFDVDLSLRALFKEPTVEALALTVTQMHLDAQDDEELAHLLAEIEHYPADALRSTLIADTSTEKEIL
jgi:amino acid adenylation domain-containing protein